MPLQLVPKNPSELGFPEKFGNWRTNQAEAVEEGIINTSRFFVPCAGTGFGKTQFYVAQAVLEGGRTAFVVQNKGLQDQIYNDYKSMGMVDIRGKSNYQCGGGVDWTCKDGHAGGCTLKGSNACPRTKAYNLARTRPLVVTNYKYWMAEHKYGLGLGNFSRVVFDEAQSCPEELASSLQVSISFNEMELLKSDFPPKRSQEDTDIWKKWATRMRILAQEAYQIQFNKVRSHRDPKTSWLKDLHHFKNMVQKFATVATMRAGDWVWEEGDNGWQFDPIRFGRFSESRMFMKIPRVTMTSATIRPKTVTMMNVKADDINFLDIPSPFDPTRSPIYSVPTMRVDRRAVDYSPLIHRGDQIMGPRLKENRNGIILTTSFGYRDNIFQKSQYRRRMVSHWEGDASSNAVKIYKKNGGVLISPSISTGYDFPGDECRFSIMTKIPWQPTQSKIIKARQQLDRDSSAYYAFQKIIQFAGRGNRSEDDWCENFILDDHFSQWFFNQYKYLAPRSFIDRYRMISSVPKMLRVA